MVKIADTDLTPVRCGASRARVANRTLDFITKHNLKAQFNDEENGVGNGQTALKEN